ncbi:MAG: hypothetical protein ACYSSI_07070 [Planctomycetota bacterium]|jgi:hypothetical protein
MRLIQGQFISPKKGEIAFGGGWVFRNIGFELALIGFELGLNWVCFSCRRGVGNFHKGLL